MQSTVSSVTVRHFVQPTHPDPLPEEQHTPTEKIPIVFYGRQHTGGILTYVIMG